MKKMILLLLLLTVFCGCSKKQENNAITKVETVETSDGGFVSSFTLQGHEIYVYQPKDIMNGNIINYGYSAPFLLVFGEGKMKPQEAVSFIIEKGIDKIAQKNGGSVIFINPQKSWDREKEGIYEAVLARTMVGQTGFSHGLIKDAQSREYYLFASPAQTCIYGYGKGANYIAQYCLKPLTGVSSMSSLGSDEITATAAVLENLSITPVIEEQEIIVVSLNNASSIDQEAGKMSNNYHISTASFDKVYDEFINGYQRWNGKLSETFNAAKLGLKMDTMILEVDTSPDNKQASAKTHLVGVVVYALEKTDKKKRPLVLCFHGGGDTAITTATIAGWPVLAAEEDFILAAIEMHTRTTATETIQVIEQLKKIYAIDETRIYATGFSMGGVKTWDLSQEYPEYLAARAPRGATTAVGQNTQFAESPYVNEDVMVPLFYAGGESSQLQELPVQGLTVCQRIMYLFRVNGIPMEFELSTGKRWQWTDNYFGYAGDIVEELIDESYPDSLTTIRYYRSTDGNIYTALCSIRRHQHEIRPFTCQQAWNFMKQFSRVNGKTVIDK
ncbi:MAG: hypothetical protein IJM15_04895 [Erysipelotrichaceae bacterium]|nr:hypothetical protein [Erysipelotrichaceae bacterium]